MTATERDFSPEETHRVERECSGCRGSGRNRHSHGYSFRCPDCCGRGWVIDQPHDDESEDE